MLTEMLLDGKGSTRLKAPGSHDTHGHRRARAGLLAAGQEASQLRRFDPDAAALTIGGAISHWLAHPEFRLDAAAYELESFTLAAIRRVDQA
ncbi:hypothetical protein ABZ769_26165 [Streptomyces olivoreticuli]